MKNPLVSSIYVVAVFTIGVFLSGCSSGPSTVDEPAMKGSRPQVLTPDPSMKAPEDRPGNSKGSGSGAGQG